MTDGHRDIASEMERLHEKKGDTWPKILRYNYETYGDTQRAMRHKHYGVWQPYTWKNYYHHVKNLALGFLALGFSAEDRVLIIGDNAPQWYYAELASQSNHGASVGLYSEITPSEIQYLAQNSEAAFAVVEDQEQVDKFLQVKNSLPLLRKVIYWNYKGLAHYDDPLLMGYAQVLELGKEYEEKNPHVFEKNVASGKADDVAVLVYTSGAEGRAPKGVIHTFRTLMAGAVCYQQQDIWTAQDNVVPYLPPAWMTEQVYGIGCHLLSACTLNFAEAPETQRRDTRETKPSIVIYGARQWESQASSVQARILSADPVKKAAYRLLMPMGYKLADLKNKRLKPSLIQRILYFFFDLILFRPIKNTLGLSHARICYSTSAILSPDAFKFYHALNIPLKSIYGTTEGGALCGAKNGDIHLETVGPPYDGVEAKVSDRGELLYRHPGIFRGYYGDRAKTDEVLKDGWFHSGDCGFIREDGHVVFVDRLKDLIQLPHGGRLAPQSIESLLRFSPYISDAWVLAGPQNDYPSAVVIINYDSISRWAGQRRLAFTNFSELSQNPEVYELVRKDIDRINKSLDPGVRVKKFVNLHREFDPDEGEITRTRKLRRTFLSMHYRELIDAIYGDNSEVSIETQDRRRVGREEKTKTMIRIQAV